MKLKGILIIPVAFFVALTSAKSASAMCNPCMRGSGCEAPCIDAGTCACSVGNQPPPIQGCQTPMPAWELSSSSGPYNPNGNDWDITANIPYFSISPANGCPGYAICEKTYSGAPSDTWQVPYTTSDGHVHWNVGSFGSSSVNATIGAWPVIGPQANNFPEIQAVYTPETAVPGNGLVESPAIPGITPSTSFSCVYAREGNLGHASGQGSIGAYFSGNSVYAGAVNPAGGNSEHNYIKLLSLYQAGGIHVSSVKASSSSSNVLLAANCRAAGFVQIVSNVEQIFWSGSSAYLAIQVGTNSTEGQCLLP